MNFTDLTRILLQWRRFFRPFDLETRGPLRVLHSLFGNFAGAITIFGFAIAVGTYLYKNLIEEQAKNIVSTLNSAESYYYTVRKIDELGDRAAEINARLQPQNFTPDTAFLANHPNTYANWRKRLADLYKALPEEDAQELDQEVRPLESEIDEAVEGLQRIFQSQNLSQEQKRAEIISQDKRILDLDLKLEEKCIASFSKDKEKELKQLKFVTRASYFLYAFGLAVGVLGQLSGIKTRKVERGLRRNYPTGKTPYVLNLGARTFRKPRRDFFRGKASLPD